jgi:N-acetylglucosamine-6-phosphate deacetylase
MYKSKKGSFFYEFGGQEIFVKNGKTINKEGSIAGSLIGMKDARKNFADWIDDDLDVLTKITVVNPAKQIGI